MRYVRRLMLVNISMKFHEDILNVFSSYRADTILSLKLLLTKFKGALLKKYIYKSSGSCDLHII